MTAAEAKRLTRQARRDATTGVPRQAADWVDLCVLPHVRSAIRRIADGHQSHPSVTVDGPSLAHLREPVERRLADLGYRVYSLPCLVAVPCRRSRGPWFDPGPDLERVERLVVSW